MLSEKEFIEKVWSKYEVYSTKESMKKSKFFAGNLYKNTHFMLVLKTCALSFMMIVFTVALTGGVYAGIKNIVKNKIEFVEEDAEIRDENSLGYSYIEGMEYLIEPEIYYKKINSYEEYLNYKNTYSNFIDMDVNEFENYFLLVFLASRYYKYGLYVDYVGIKDDTIYVDLGKKEYKDNPIVFVKLNRENDRKNVEVNFLENEPIMTNYVARDELPKDYTLVNAVEDNCVVLKSSTEVYGKELLSKENKLKEFAERTKKGVNDNIRIVEDSYYGLIITDIEFRDGEYIICEDRSHMYIPYENERVRLYFVSEKIEVKEETWKDGITRELYVLFDRNLGLGVEYCIIE